MKRKDYVLLVAFIAIVALNITVLFACDGWKFTLEKKDGQTTEENAVDPGEIEESAHQHSFSEWVTLMQATCNTNGERTRSCECGEVESETIAALGHSDEDGDKICDRCGEYLGVESEGIQYALNPDGFKTYLVSGYNGTETEIVIPPIHNGSAVVGIKNSAFFSNRTLTAVTILDGLTFIGESAFSGCSNLTSVNVGNGVTTIGKSAFSGCRALTSVIVPDTLTNIYNGFFDCDDLQYNEYDNGYYLGNADNPYVVLVRNKNDEVVSCEVHENTKCICYYAFRDCRRLTSITLPDELRFIGEEAFGSCGSLFEIVIPDSVTEIGKRAFALSGLKTIALSNRIVKLYDQTFYYCENLFEIVIPDSVAEMGNQVFKGCRNLSRITGNAQNASIVARQAIPNSFRAIITSGTSIGKDAFRTCSGLTSVSIPSSITSIEEGAFYGCRNLAGISLPNGVTEIGNQAFYMCMDLVSVTVPNSVTQMGYGVFSECSNLYTLVLSDSLTVLSDNTLSGCGNLASVTMPSGLTRICSSAFLGCGNLTEINIPDSVTRIEFDAFSFCTGLTGIVLPSSLTNIGHGAFAGCTELTTIVIPDGVINIGYDAFGTCNQLESVALPSSLTTIEYSAFKKCSALRSITFASTGAQWDSVEKGRDWNQGTGYFTIRCTDVTLDKNGNIVTDEGTESIVEPDGVRYTLADDAYLVTGYVGSPTSVVIPAEIGSIPVTGISGRAFSECHSLVSVALPESVTDVAASAFYKCDQLASITVAEGNEVYHAQGNCLIITLQNTIIIGCKSSVIPSDGSVTYIAEKAFDGCVGLTEIEIPESVSGIGRNAFRGCPIEVARVPAYACSYIKGKTLREVVITCGTDIENYAFSGCEKLTSVTLADSVTSIGVCAFRGCGSLAAIDLKNVTQIHRGAFMNCTGLTSITIPYGVTCIYTGTFNGCGCLSDVIIADTVVNIQNDAFYGCAGLTAIVIPDSVTEVGVGAFEESSLVEITFAGTKAQWNALIKSRYDVGNGSFTVHCSDGDIIE